MAVIGTSFLTFDAFNPAARIEPRRSLRRHDIEGIAELLKEPAALVPAGVDWNRETKLQGFILGAVRPLPIIGEWLAAALLWRQIEAIEGATSAEA